MRRAIEPLDYATIVRRMRMRSVSSGPVFRNTHLFVEPWDGHQNAELMEDFTVAGLWPETLDVGRLEWDDPNGFCCVFCYALLLRSEADVVPGAPGVHKGKYCCATGHRMSSAQTLITWLIDLFVRLIFDSRLSAKYICLQCRSCHSGCNHCGWAGLGAHTVKKGLYAVRCKNSLASFKMRCPWHLRL